MSATHTESYTQFMKDNRDLLECYASLRNPFFYKIMDTTQQRDFCYVQRVKVEEQLIKGKLKAEDFWPQQ